MGKGATATQRAGESLTADQMARVDQARARTSVRIVPVVAGSSGRYDRAEELVSLWAAALGLALIWLLLAGAPVGAEWALPGRVWRLGFVAVIAVIVLGFLTGALVATRIAWLRRLFIPRRMALANARERAGQVLNNCLIRHRQEGPYKVAVIYVSLYERAVVVTAGEPLLGQLDPRQIQAIQKQVRSALLGRRLCEGLCQGIEELSQLLSRLDPPPADIREPAQTCLTLAD